MKLETVTDKSPRHKWGDPVSFAADPKWSGCERNERTCVKCGMVKITMIPPGHGEQAWREFRKKDAWASFQCEATPGCISDQPEGA